MKIKYSKPALSIAQQADLLIEKGLIVNLPSLCHDFLSRISYHRLYQYFQPFLATGEGAKFLSGTHFETIVDLYEFDKDLRSLIDEALEVFEVAFRTAISNTMSIKYGPFWFMDRSLFQNKNYHQKFLEYIQSLSERADEHAIKQYFKKYDELYPPSWLLLENLTFGSCSKLFNNIRSVRDKKEICSIFEQHPTVLDSWAKALVYTRNLCAHHARVWNRWLVIQPISPMRGNLIKNTRPIYSHLHVMSQLMQTLFQNTTWKVRLNNLFAKNGSIQFEEMGFLRNWQHDPFFD